MALHEQPGVTDEWYTPPYIFEALGCRFDMDVASASAADWVPAEQYISAGSLHSQWEGFVWMNPPFGRRNTIVPWLNRFIAHDNGICLVPDRTSAPWWQAWAPEMDAILFVSPKIKFIGADGRPGRSPAQGTCLGARGAKGHAALRHAANVSPKPLGVLL